MANKKGKKNRQKCNQEFGNGDGIHNSRSRAADQKTKSKRNQHVFMNENDYRHRLQELMYTPEDIFAKIFRKDGPALGDEFGPLPSNAFPGGKNLELENCCSVLFLILLLFVCIMFGSELYAWIMLMLSFPITEI